MSTFATKIRIQKILVIFTTLLKPHNIGIHSKGIEISFQVIQLLVENWSGGGDILFLFLITFYTMKGQVQAIVESGFPSQPLSTGPVMAP
jgi:hypothetical protein